MERRIFITYYRKPCKDKTKKGAPRGVVVAIEKGIIGWALCGKRDVFDKKLGLTIALQRAEKAEKLSKKEREEFYSKVPNSLKEKFNWLLVKSHQIIWKNMK